jgi:hypothetical protein
MATRLRYYIEVNGYQYYGGSALRVARKYLRDEGYGLLGLTPSAILQKFYVTYPARTKCLRVWRERRNGAHGGSQYLLYLKQCGLLRPRARRQRRA